MSELEKYIIENRQRLDQTEQPNIEKMWGEISSDIEVKHRPRNEFLLRLKKVSIAAAFVLLGCVGTWLYLGGEKSTPEIADFYPELVPVAESYQQAIAVKESTIPFDSLEPLLFDELLSELDQLENMHQQTLKDLPKYAQNERLIDALMRYYERKLQILERLSKEYNKSIRHEKNREIAI